MAASRAGAASIPGQSKRAIQATCVQGHYEGQGCFQCQVRFQGHRWFRWVWQVRLKDNFQGQGYSQGQNSFQGQGHFLDQGRFQGSG